MHPRLRSASVSLVLVAGAALAIVAPAAPAGADAGGTDTNASAHRVTLAVIGDVPYGTVQEATFGDLVGAVNADPKVRRAIHVGDIKNGSTTCTDERFAAVKATFDTFEDPLVYTPGDNEWTDCHRANNGAYNPLERLAAVRRLFFPEPGATLGRHPDHVAFESGLVENVRWIESRTAFATLHVIGSDNGLAPWTGLGFTAPTPAQAAEVADRNARTVAWIDETFDAAAARGLAGVALFMQADTFGPGPSPAQQAVVDRIAARAAAFPGKVLLVQGDSHTFKVDTPLANVTRIVVHGETLPFEYLRLTVDPRDPAVFSWERTPVAPAA
jgi:hypothetical protein